ncbi:Dynamin-related protein 3A [Camellia lanceoleosa]|uniref:Dynamin-related protein 3A n=1 Tax=Camellia lanceoleosa TaxID=1840588 RepID=A0ACC0G9K7_9ERIC|nr:Dynamin-related protein 3A [Camellia lanceoleosa]
MSGVYRDDLIPCDLIQEETASALNLLQSRWSDIVEMKGSEEAVVDRFKYIPDSVFLARARNLVSKLDALPMAGSVHSHGVGGGMADSKVHTPIGGRSGSGGRRGRGGRGQNPVALNPELNVVVAVDNAAPDKSWTSVVAPNQRSSVKLRYFPPSSSHSTIVVDLPRRESVESGFVVHLNKILELGFGKDIEEILDLLGSRKQKSLSEGNAISRISEFQRQNLLLSTTLNEKVNNLAKMSLENPIMIGLNDSKLQTSPSQYHLESLGSDVDNELKHSGKLISSSNEEYKLPAQLVQRYVKVPCGSWLVVLLSILKTLFELEISYKLGATAVNLVLWRKTCDVYSNSLLAFSSVIEGKNEEMSTSELSGGAQIHYIFQSIFVKSLEVDPCEDLVMMTSDRHSNATGPKSALFVPEVPFEVLVRRRIVRLLDPSLQCARFIYDELIKARKFSMSIFVVYGVCYLHKGTDLLILF